MLSSWADSKHRQLEKQVLAKADSVVTIGYTMTKEMEELGAKRVETITNGFDEDDFPETQARLDTEFSISHIGTFSPTRNHPKFWQALAELKTENQAFANALKVRTVGVVDHHVAASMEQAGLSENWERIDYVSHDKVLEYQRSSRVLLVSINDSPNATGILPGKFFEYLASGRPILAIGPKQSDIGTVLSKTKAGIIVEKDDLEEMKQAILTLFEENQNLQRNETEIAKFSRRGLTRQMVELLNSLA
jgi:glycosyltransferase involved in cell wall biosynthesis